MNRDFDKIMEQYERIKPVNGAFNTDDIDNISQNSEDAFHVIFNALKYGYVLGYNKCKRDIAKKNQQAKKRKE